jgi:hypothetical protein
LNEDVRYWLIWLISNAIAPAIMYEDMPTQSIVNLVKEKSRVFYGVLRSEDLIDFNGLSFDEAKQLGFAPWSRDTVPGLYVFPLWLVPLIPDGLTVYNLNKEPFEFHQETTELDAEFMTIFDYAPFGLMFGEGGQEAD